MSTDLSRTKTDPSPLTPIASSAVAQPRAAGQSVGVDGGGSGSKRLRLRAGRIILFAVVGAVLGLCAGYFSTASVYRSVGVIEIDPLMPYPATAAGDSGAMVMFDSFVHGQIEQLLSAKVIEAALHSDVWLSLGPGDEPDDARLFRERLHVTRPADSRTQIRVAFDDPNRQAAACGVAAVIDAYQSMVQPTDLVPSSDVIDELIAQRTLWQAQLDSVDAQLSELTGDLGPEGIDATYLAHLTEMRKIETALVDVRVAQTMLSTRPREKQLGDDNPDRRLFILAQQDTTLDTLLARHRIVSSQLEGMLGRMGDAAPAVVRTREGIASLEQRIDDRAAEVERSNPVRVVNVELAGVGGKVMLTAEQLAELQEHLTARLTAVRSETESLAAKQGQVRQLRDRAAMYQQQIDDARYRLDRLAAAAPISGNVRVVSRGDVPTSPYRDQRARRAVTGGIIGMLLLGGAMAMLVLIDQRMQQPKMMLLADDTIPLLGAIPTISKDASDAHDSNLTALSIHEIRALLQVRAKQQDHRAFAITSPGAGAGKTSLTVGLASSLALGGTRTLLVDCELVSRVLSAPRNRSAHGQPSVSQPQSLDQVMLDMGFLSEHDTSVFLLPQDRDTGLLGMLSGQPLANCVIDTNIEGLSVLPALSMQAQHVAKLNGKFIRRLIDEARDAYDMVLFDTGPIPGSVEAMVVASEVDGVVIVTPRGETQQRYTCTLSYLRLVGATVVGTVFNRAAAGDLTLQVPNPMRREAGKSGAQPQPMLSAARRSGSGILAAAVHSQAKSQLAQKLAASESTSTTTEYDTHTRQGEADSDDQQVTLEDTGAIADILLDDDDEPKPVITADPRKIKPRGNKSSRKT